MKKDWEIKKLGDICDLLNGYAFKSSQYVEKGIRVIRITNVQNGYIVDDEPKFYPNDKENLLKDYMLSAGDLLISLTGNCGRVGILTEDFLPAALNQRVSCLRIKDNSVLKSFLFHLLNNKDFENKCMDEATGAAQKNMSTEWLKKQEFSVPPLEEQKRIVKILDEKFTQLETIKVNAQTNLQNAKDLFQSQLAKVFSNITWEKAKLEDIALDFSRGKSKHRPRNDKCLFGGNYPFIQTGDVRNADKYVTDYSETYNETGLAQSKLWPAGTLCITIAANIAETAILSFPCCFPDSVIGFIPNEKLTTVDFVYYLIQFFKSELQNLSKGAAQDNLNLAKFENMNFPLPPLPEQKRIVKELDALSEKVRQLQEIYTKQIANCAELKQSLLQKAFEGEL